MKFCSGKDLPAARPAKKVPCPLISLEGTSENGSSAAKAALISSMVNSVP